MHAEQVLKPPPEYVPAVQMIWAPPEQAYPAGHGEHPDWLVAPVPAKYVPLWQIIGDDDPPGQYDPEGHIVQTEAPEGE